MRLSGIFRRIQLIEVIYVHYLRLKAKIEYNSIEQPPLRKGSALNILPHEGTGDLVAILPALRYLSKQGYRINLYTEEAKWEQLSSAVLIDFSINVLNFTHKKNYETRDLREVNFYAKLGSYGNVSVHSYPDSFYKQLGVPVEIAEEHLVHMPLHLQWVPKKYTYINVRHSSGKHNIDQKLICGCKIISISDTRLIVIYEKKINKIRLSKKTSLQTNLNLALRADEVYCSDAAIYNILIRLAEHPPLWVFTRKPRHTHNQRIYSIFFDGKRHYVPAKCETGILTAHIDMPNTRTSTNICEWS